MTKNLLEKQASEEAHVIIIESDLWEQLDELSQSNFSSLEIDASFTDGNTGERTVYYCYLSSFDKELKLVS